MKGYQPTVPEIPEVYPIPPRGMTKVQRPRSQYEYRVLEIGKFATLRDLEERLNLMARDGWRLLWKTEQALIMERITH